MTYLKKILSQANLNISDIETIGVTGGRHADLPNEIDNVLVAHFNEVDAIGRGAKALKKELSTSSEIQIFKNYEK